ncbi:MAG: hypothetical protein MJK04_25965, partial [Psychrosphaera sp.]|nr:hypothetical protein [Psychrosphaera sp.]
GFTAITQKLKYIWLSVVNQCLHIIGIDMDHISVDYIGIGDIGVEFGWAINESVEFNLTAAFEPGFSFIEHATALSVQTIQFDLIAVVFVIALLSVNRFIESATQSS